MEVLGINSGYLLIQLFCLCVIPVLIIGGFVYWLSKRNSRKQDD